jgi:hypothetical protein
VGGSTGSPFSATQPNFDVVTRSATGMPKSGVLVLLDFGPATPGVRVIDAQNPGVTVNCAAHSISELTNATGHAAFNVRFAGWTNPPHVQLFAGGNTYAILAARSTAMSTTSPATALAALSLFAARYGTAAPEADFDLSGGPVGLGDFSIFAGEYLQAQPAQGLCP